MCSRRGRDRGEQSINLTPFWWSVKPTRSYKHSHDIDSGIPGYIWPAANQRFIGYSQLTAAIGTRTKRARSNRSTEAFRYAWVLANRTIPIVRHRVLPKAVLNNSIIWTAVFADRRIIPRRRDRSALKAIISSFMDESGAIAINPSSIQGEAARGNWLLMAFCTIKLILLAKFYKS